MMQPQQPDPRHTTPIANWRGLNERRVIGADPRETASLDNVVVRNGTVQGRKGSALWGAVSTPAANNIIGLWQFDHSGSNAAKLVRMTATSMQYWNTTVWTDITGTALTGLANTRPQAATIGELEMFVTVNEGNDRPRKWTGSGNTAELATSNAPYAHAVEFWKGFLGLGNISDDGSTFFPLDLILSDDPDGTWVECDETEIYVTRLTIDETPGAILACKVLGDDLLIYKTDGIVVLSFTGGVTRFRRRKLDFPMGLLAPLSLQCVGTSRHIFLAEDRNLYSTNGQAVQQFPRNVQKSLRDDMPALQATWAVGAVDEDSETYHFFYPRGGSEYNKGKISLNYTSEEFTKSLYPYEISSAVGFRATTSSDMVIVAGTGSNLVYQLDTQADDNGTAISRYFDVDWSQLGAPGDKHLLGGEFVFTKSANCRVKISVAVDKSSVFQFPRTFSLKGTDPDETVVRIPYRTPTPLYGSWFKFRVQMYHDGNSNVAELLEFEPESVIKHPIAEDSFPRPYSGQRS